jgi:hypothetical protein
VPTLVTDAQRRVRHTPIPDVVYLSRVAFRVSDDELTSAPGTVLISVGAANLPPIVFNQSVAVEVFEDRGGLITLLGDDADSGQWTAFVSRRPRNGGSLFQATDSGDPLFADNLPVQDIVRHQVLYVPPADTHGALYDELWFYAVDALGLRSATDALVRITILPVNDLPLIEPSESFADTDEDVPLAVHLPGTDVDTAAAQVQAIVLSVPLVASVGALYQHVNDSWPQGRGPAILSVGTRVTSVARKVWFKPAANAHGIVEDGFELFSLL